LLSTVDDKIYYLYDVNLKNSSFNSKVVFLHEKISNILALLYLSVYCTFGAIFEVFAPSLTHSCIQAAACLPALPLYRLPTSTSTVKIARYKIAFENFQGRRGVGRWFDAKTNSATKILTSCMPLVSMISHTYSQV